jgi:8-oxo-dGTP diphosphatase
MRLRGIPVHPGWVEGTVRLRRGRSPTHAQDVTRLADIVDPSTGGAIGHIHSDPPKGSRLPNQPAISLSERDLLRNGDVARLDGRSGHLDLPNVEEVHVVTVFLKRSDGRILLLRRSRKVGSFQGRWAGVSGYLEVRTAKGQALREIAEETGLASSGLTLKGAGPVLRVRGGSTVYAVHPFLFESSTEKIRLDWEHTESRWIRPTDIRRYPTVPKLADAWNSLRPVGAPSRGSPPNRRSVSPARTRVRTKR